MLRWERIVEKMFMRNFSSFDLQHLTPLEKEVSWTVYWELVLCDVKWSLRLHIDNQM